VTTDGGADLYEMTGETGSCKWFFFFFPISLLMLSWVFF
jgi:hypothetical protein